MTYALGGDLAFVADDGALELTKEEVLDHRLVQLEMRLVGDHHLLLVRQLFGCNLLVRRVSKTLLHTWLIHSVDVLVQLIQQELDKLIRVVLLITFEQAVDHPNRYLDLFRAVAAATETSCLLLRCIP